MLSERQSKTGACPLLRTTEVLAGQPDPISAVQSRLLQQHSTREKTSTKFSSTKSCPCHTTHQNSHRGSR